MPSIKMSPWEKLSVITDSSHHETLRGLAAECWEVQNNVHHICNYLDKIHTFFTVSHSFLQCLSNSNIMTCSETCDSWEKRAQIICGIKVGLQFKLKWKYILRRNLSFIGVYFGLLGTYLVKIVLTKERTFKCYTFCFSVLQHSTESAGT